MLRQIKKAEERNAIGMLLDANWSASRGIFVKVIKGEAGGLPVHWEEYYNEDGQRIGNDDGRR